MSREAMQLALEALEDYVEEYGPHEKDSGAAYAIKALRQALETEPFEYWNAVEGWVKIDEVREHFDAVGCGTIYKSAGEGRSPLYTAPPKREWVGLTKEDMLDCDNPMFDTDEFYAGMVWAEAKLKEKNS